MTSILRKHRISILIGTVMLFSTLANATDPSKGPQGSASKPFGPAGNDQTTSMGSFKIKIVNKFAAFFGSCSYYDPTNKILSSGTLFDPATIVGRSDVSLTGHDIANTPFEAGSVNVGMAGTLIHKDRLIPPPTYPCFGDDVPSPGPPPQPPTCSSGTGTRKVDTEIRSLRMTDGVVVVRAGMHYNEDPNWPNPTPSPTPVTTMDIVTSPGKVQSRSGPSNDPTRDFPATSFFNVYVKVDLPQGFCGLPQGVTLYNQDPLKVVNKMLDKFPPKLVYIHDTSSIVPILFLTNCPIQLNGSPAWVRGEVLGYFLLAGHGIGFDQSNPYDVAEFANQMQGQSNAQCPIP